MIDRDDPACAAADPPELSIRRCWLDPGFSTFLGNYLGQLHRLGRTAPDPVVPNSFLVYGDATFDVLLGSLTDDVSEWAGRSLLPTYSFARLYGPGSSLRRHRDRAACEYSVSVTLLSEGDEPWPLWIESPPDAATAVELGCGDAVLYQGTKLTHWRDSIDERWHAQLFLHWVDADGPWASLHLDGRDQLGAPSVREEGQE